MSVTVEIAFDLAVNGQGDFFTLDDPVKGELDNATYLLGGDVFVDVTDRVRSARVSRGRSSQLARFTAASGQLVLDNRDRAFDPNSAPVLYDSTTVDYDSESTGYDTEGSPYYGSILPRKQVRITDDGSLIALLQVEKWEPDYSLSGDAVVLVSLEDGLATLYAATLTAGTATAQATGARIDAILDDIDWPTGLRSVDAGQADLTADVIAEGTNALTYLQRVETSEPGAFFMAKDGRVAFRDRASLQQYTSGLVFGTGSGQVPFTEPFRLSYGTDEMCNRAIVTYSGGTATVDDASSQASYGIISRTIDTLLDDEADAEALAQWVVTQNSQPRVRVKQMRVHRHGLSDEQAALVIGLELGDPAAVEWTPSNVGDLLTQVVSIDQIAHDISRGGTVHEIDFTFSETTAAFILDDSLFGVLDQSILGY